MSGLIRVRTTKEFGESTVSKILDLVENASSRKSKSEDFISKFARVYTPAVCIAALALAVLPPLVRLLFLGLPAAWGDVDLPRADVPGHLLPMRAGHQHPALLLCGGIGGASNAGVLVKGSNLPGDALQDARRGL